MGTRLKESPSRWRAVTLHVGASFVLQGVILAHAFLLVPVAVEAVGAECYGYWLASGGLLGWLGLSNFGTATVTLQRCAYAYGLRDYQATRDWFAHGVVAASISSSVVIAFLTPLAILGPQFLGVPASSRSDLTRAIAFAAAGAALVPVNDTARGFLCAVQRNGIGVTAEILGGLCSFATAWIGLQYGFGVQILGAAVLVRVLAALSVNGLFAWMCVRQVAPTTKWESAKFQDYRRSGAALWSASALGQIAPQLPPVLITKLIGPESALAYIASTRPLVICEMLPAFAVGSLSSAISHMAGDDKSRYRLRQYLAAIGEVLMWASSTLAAAYCVGNSSFVRLWMGESFYLGPWFTAIAALAALVGSRVRWASGVNTALGSVGQTARLLSYEGIGRCILMPASVGLFGSCGIPGLSVLTSVFVLPLFSGEISGKSVVALSYVALLRRMAIGFGLVCGATAISTLWYPTGWLSWVLVMAAATTAIGIAGILASPGTYVAAVWLIKESRLARSNTDSPGKSKDDIR